LLLQEVAAEAARVEVVPIIGLAEAAVALAQLYKAGFLQHLPL
jgi:hypothetical protein